MEGITSAECPCATRLLSSAQRGGLNISEVVLAAHHPNPEAGIIPWGLGPSLRFPSIKSQWKITYTEGLVSPTSSPTQSRAGVLCSSCRSKTAQKRPLVLMSGMIHISPSGALGISQGARSKPGQISAGPSSCLRTQGTDRAAPSSQHVPQPLANLTFTDPYF